MLYLMMNKTDNEYLVKVGFSNGTANLRTRRNAYRSHNPRAIMRSTCAGSMSMESTCHSDLKRAGGVRISGTEWFSISKELFDRLYIEGMQYFRPKHSPIHFPEKF